MTQEQKRKAAEYRLSRMRWKRTYQKMIEAKSFNESMLAFNQVLKFDSLYKAAIQGAI